MIMGILTVGRSWFRVCFISMSSIPSIVSTVGLMREEGTIEGEGGTEKCKAEVCRGASGDGVERLVGIARKEIKRDVEGYKWKKEELRIPEEGAPAEAEGGAAEDPYKTWYNPVKTTLLLLSRIFSVLPMPVFDDLCRTAVSKCLENLHLASGELSELEDKVRIKTPGSANRQYEGRLLTFAPSPLSPPAPLSPRPSLPPPLSPPCCRFRVGASLLRTCSR
jgi:hypothetical protein